MADIETLLNRWQSAGLVDQQTTARIRAWEAAQARPTGIRWQGIVALVLGAILLACGVVLFVHSHWDELSPGWRYAIVMAMVAAFHIAGGLARDAYRGLSTTLHAVGTISTGAAIALVGQIFNIQEHWPTAVMLWALAAAAGWLLLRDEAQQTLTLLLFPAWIFSEIVWYAGNRIGEDVYLGRFLCVWATLYLTWFLGSRHKAVQGIIFAASIVAILYGAVMMTMGWESWARQSPVSFAVEFWAWAAIAALPLIAAAFHGHRGLIPIAGAIAFAIALPWCTTAYTRHAGPNTWSGYQPNFMAHILVAAFAVFLIWNGVRSSSRALVNFGIVGFALAVVWFYWSDIYNEMGRALGLIGLGILFLAGGWALERFRRRLIGQMDKTEAHAEVAQ